MPTQAAASDAKPMVLLLDDRSILGGGQQQLMLLAGGLRDRDWPYRIVCKRRSPLAGAATERGLEVLHLPLRSEFDLWSAARLHRLAHQLRAGIIHAHAPHAHGLMWLARMAGMRGVHIAHRHAGFPIKPNPLSAGKYRWGCDCVIAVSRGVQRNVLAIGVPESRTRVIPAVIDDSRFATADAIDLRGEFSLPAGTRLVGTVGSLERHKGHHTLIDAWPGVLQELPDAALVIVGGGPLHETLREQARALGVAHRVFLPGHRSDVAGVLAALDLFVLPSLIEGMPGALLEAMLTGLPCVATDCPGTEELIDHGRTGLIVPREDVAQLGMAIVKLLTAGEVRDQIAARGPGIVRGGFLPRHMIDATLALYAELLATTSRA